MMRQLTGAILTIFGLVLSTNLGRADEKKLLDYRTTTLPNGLRIVTLKTFPPQASNPASRRLQGRTSGTPGFRSYVRAHVPDRPPGPDRSFDLIRRTGGNRNAYTAFDQTVYVQTLPANQLELASLGEAERLGFRALIKVV